LTNSEIIKKAALDTLSLESKSIQNLSKIIDSNFIRIVELLKDCQGKIILTGIGKSAIIGMKISATLNSTGSRSVFLHLGDALHGDMGVIGKEDIVICLSKSGESNEIISLSNYLNKLQIKLIGISCVKNSSLDRMSDTFIHTQIEKEACHNNLAPTTSSTCHLAIGDAIAMAIQKLKGFSPDEFSEYHPSGSLGKRLNLSLNSLVDSNRVPRVNPLSPFTDVINEISSKMYGATAVIKEHEIIGIITDGDIRRVIEKKKNIEDLVASEFMSKDPKVLGSNILAIDALKIMRENNISQVLVKDGKSHFIGVVHILDIIKEGINNE
tara:strand:+ start:699 stop:1673 length:975 start_codon:yes stop_codon:yes gene_type:complete